MASLGRVAGGLAILRPGLEDGHVIAAPSGAGALGLLLLVLAGEGSLLLVVLPMLALVNAVAACAGIAIARRT